MNLCVIYTIGKAGFVSFYSLSNNKFNHPMDICVEHK